ncbi:hypothetical protein LY76DRAFT_599516 [Colletotrichum caudatum]|nr:hypothetical protein LY76DRAFT_599516 [Colletotrichum caudatum]
MYLLNYYHARYVSLLPAYTEESDKEDPGLVVEKSADAMSRPFVVFATVFGFLCLAIGFLGSELNQDRGLFARLKQPRPQISRC